MFWWHKAATLVRAGRTQRFGLITTNSITHVFNRRLVSHHLASGAMGIRWAIPDHPWVDSMTGAAVRIAMTCVSQNVPDAYIERVIHEHSTKDGHVDVVLDIQHGHIHSDLSVGADVASARSLMANSGITGMGVALHGAGFLLDSSKADAIRRGGDERVVRRFISGRDLVQESRERYVIDFSGMTEDHARVANTVAFQHVLDHVWPERRVNRRESIRRLWWRFGWERPELRKALNGLTRWIGTPETAKHRSFQFISTDYLPEHKIVVLASDDATILGILSSRIHQIWAKAAGGTLEDRPVYNKTRCFDPFPFPACSVPLRKRIESLGESIDRHRKTRQALHPELTITGLYNVLEKLRSGDALTATERAVHERGLVSVLRQLHDQLDAAVCDAYGWSADLTDEQILEHLVALNAERAEEEKRGLVRWLRPDFQNPPNRKPVEQKASEEEQAEPEVKPGPAKTAPWPQRLSEQIAAVRVMLGSDEFRTTVDLAEAFAGAPLEDVGEVLESLAAVGLVVANGTPQMRRWKGVAGLVPVRTPAEVGAPRGLAKAAGSEGRRAKRA
jgi:hypothetical protein